MIDIPIPLIDQVAAAVLVLAVALLAIALRGRRVSDHPVCRRCGFDLFGKPETSTRCGECGADLNRRRAVLRGPRRRRGGLAGLSLILMAIAGAKLGADAYRVSREQNWARYKPTSWLARAAESPADPKLRDESRAEILRRLEARQLSAAWVARLTERALVIQADLSKPWDSWWGEVVQRARITEQLPGDAWHRYLGHAWPMHVKAQPLQRRGEPVIVRVVRDPQRSGKSFWLRDTSILTVRIGGQQLLQLGASRRGFPSDDTVLFTLSREEADAVGDGTHSVVVTREMHVREYVRQNGSRSSTQVVFTADAFSATTTLPEVTTTIAPADHVILDRDPALTEAVRGAVSIARCTYGQPPHEGRASHGFGTFVVTFRVQSPPQALAYEVLLRTEPDPSPAGVARPGRWPRGPLHFRIDELTCPARFQGELVARYDDVPDFRLKNYTLVLRPSVAVAQAAGLPSASGEEIVFTNVKVERPGDSK